MMTTTLAGIAAVLGFSGGVIAIVSRFLPHQHTAPVAPAAPAVEAALWLVCNSTACAHLTRRHTRHPDGTATCNTCHPEQAVSGQ